MSTFTPQEYADMGVSFDSAHRILPVALNISRARSLVDVGCGVGDWLAVAHSLGINDYLGVDGEGAARILRIPRDRFMVGNLLQPQPIDRTFDLAMSLETAEHLPPESARPFIAHLTSLAPWVLFSAAVPGQKGVRHVNEQWPRYWASLFAELNYMPMDVIRPLIWNDPAIPFCYRQNTLLYGRRDALPPDYTPPPMLDVVHPELLTHYVSMRYVSVRMAVKAIVDSVAIKLGVIR